jgi:putative transposase
MGSRGDALDNAMAESFFATPEVECLAKYRLATHIEMRLTVVRYIQSRYNPHRRHSAIGQRFLLALE